MPFSRDPKKLYLWWTLEKNHDSQLTEFDNTFNLTFSYRSDSGIYAPYGSTNLILQEILKAGDYDVDSLLEKKRKSNKVGVWVVSELTLISISKYSFTLSPVMLDADYYVINDN